MPRPDIRLSVLIFALLAIRVVCPQSAFENLTIRHGLSSNVVYFIFKDAKGFIWFGTDGGLNRYDSRSIRAFTNNPQDPGSLPANIISQMYQRTDDELLLLGNIGTIISYKYSTGKFRNISAEHPVLKTRSIACIYKDRKGDFWLATDIGLLHTNKDFKVIKEYVIPGRINPHPHANKVNIIIEDRKGEFWLGMYFRGLMTFSPKKGQFSIERFVPAVAYSQVRTMQYLPGGDHIFVSAEGVGVLKFNIYNYSYTKYTYRRGATNSLPDNHVQALKLQGDSVLWMGHLQGLSKLNLRTEVFTHYQNNPRDQKSLVNNWIANLYIDNQNILWVATFGGVSATLTTKPRFQKFFYDPADPFTLPSNTVQTAYKDKRGNMWFGTSMGFGILPPAGGKIYRYAVPRKSVRMENSEVSSFLEDGDNMWIGSWGSGLARTVLPPHFKPGQALTFSEFMYDSADNRSLSSNFVRNLSRDVRGNILISTWNGGINIIPASQKNFTQVSFQRIRAQKGHGPGLASDFVENILPDRDGNLWCMTGPGLQRINFEKGEYEFVRAIPDSANNILNTCTNLIQASTGDLYGSSFGGFVRIMKKPDIGYQSKAVYAGIERGTYSLIEDKHGHIWFSTVRSEIGRYEPENGKMRFFSLIDEVDGFDFYLGKAAIDEEGNIYFVGKSGYVVFNPDAISDNTFAPPVFLTSIRVQDKEILPATDIAEVNHLDLGYEERGITITFAGLNYQHSEGNQYRYRIQGSNNGWISLGRNPVISFYELKPGTHTFILSASNNDGRWSGTDRRLTLTIHPPFWDTTIFKVAAILAGLMLISGFFLDRIRTIRKEQQQQNLFSQRLIESQEAARKSLSKELHDGLGQNLLVVKNWLSFYLSSDEKDEDDLQKINDLVQEAVTEVKEISMNLHPNLLDKLGFTRAINSMIRKLNEMQKPPILAEIETIDDYISKDAEINLYRIIQECLNNIIKHADAASAVVRISEEGGLLRIVVSDDGKGFDTGKIKLDEQKPGLGLTSLKERASYIGAKLSIQSTPGKGTTVIITLDKQSRENAKPN